MTPVPTSTPQPNPAMISQGTVFMTIFIAAVLTILILILVKILFDYRKYRYMRWRM